MEKKKVTKLVLKKTAIANLDGSAMNLLKGGSAESTFCRDNTNSSIHTRCGQGTCVSCYCN